ncbi:MurR/RpiR family transcriptional regulator [Ruania alba]|uniref:DNA-binding transcriptional regulator, MurR/RpiR family, contains HTH and SIS domains n=1 Tax=Ruania alba TaxID=648782 RepID=A0A1H5N3W5_9MICO|nr:MurR/RpiR family transcriptional regulator [Ruania alba]SEE96233.1 DNA-binding transcriptional regulator, MurR/RpiR family, contains HTH and SIS domains [Ruania alba]
MPASTQPERVPLVTRVGGMLPELRPAERRVAQAVLADPAAVARESITALAQRCDTSPPTVVRFAKRMGFPGYPQLRLALAKDAGLEEGRTAREPLSGTLDASHTLEQVVASIGYADARAVEDTSAMLDIPALTAAVDALVNARRIDLVGVGASAISAIDLDQKLSRLGLVTVHHPERHLAMTAISLRSAGDVVIALSHSGSTTDVVAPTALARSQGATTIAITNHPGSQLAQAADITLVTASRETTFRSGAMASRIAQLVVIDCLFVGVAMRDMPTTQAALDASFRAVADL